MKVINLRDIYPHYTQDCFVEVTDEVADLFSEFDHKEAAYRLRTYRHKAYYSLDRNDGIEHEALFVALSPHELCATVPLPGRTARATTMRWRCRTTITSAMSRWKTSISPTSRFT